MFSEGEQVLHVDNNSQLMRVERVILQKYDIPSSENPSIKIPKTKILGIKCHWWEELPGGKRTFREGEFRKSELIPYDIGLGMNYAQIIQWVEDNVS